MSEHQEENTNEPEYFWRLESSYFGEPVELVFSRYKVVRKTPNGVWLDTYGKEKFVLLKSAGFPTRKRFAHATPEEALASFKIRNDWRITYLERDLKRAKAAGAIAAQMPTTAIDATKVYSADDPWGTTRFVNICSVY